LGLFAVIEVKSGFTVVFSILGVIYCIVFEKEPGVKAFKKFMTQGIQGGLLYQLRR
jgi:hypothetical protein